MKIRLLNLALLASILLASSLAHAQTVTLTGEAVEEFISKHFPDAEIPGKVKGAFQYINKNGEHKQGYAECSVPYMGDESDGGVASCTVQY